MPDSLITNTGSQFRYNIDINKLDNDVSKKAADAYIEGDDKARMAANSVFTQCLIHDTKNGTDHQMETVATNKAFFSAVDRAAHTVSDADGYRKDAIDVNGDGNFNRADLNEIDANNDGIINEREMQGHLMGVYADHATANDNVSMDRNRIQIGIRANKFFDGDGNFDRSVFTVK